MEENKTMEQEPVTQEEEVKTEETSEATDTAEETVEAEPEAAENAGTDKKGFFGKKKEKKDKKNLFLK